MSCVAERLLLPVLQLMALVAGTLLDLVKNLRAFAGILVVSSVLLFLSSVVTSSHICYRFALKVIPQKRHNSLLRFDYSDVNCLVGGYFKYTHTNTHTHLYF